MKKFVTAIVLAICFCALLVPACSNDGDDAEVPENILAKPTDTSLEFWVAENVADVDFSEYVQEYGWFGCDAYFGKGYEIEKGNNYTGVVRPEHYVMYNVGHYPDESSGGRYITYIEITDPTVSVYGITCNSSYEKFNEVFGNMGGELSDRGLSRTATFGKVSINLFNGQSNGTLRIRVDVTNIYGIMY